MAQQKKGNRAKGPVFVDGEWKYRYPKTGFPAYFQIAYFDIVDGKPKPTTEKLPFTDEASEALALARAQDKVASYNCEMTLAAGTTIGDGIEAYPKALVAGYDAPGTKTGIREPLGDESITTEIHRLEAFFDDELLVLPVADLTAAQCQARYEVLRAEQAFDTVYYTMGVARRFLQWCVIRKWARENVMIGVRARGRKKHGGKGKHQLNFDDLAKWNAKAIELAEDGDVGAAAALLCSIFRAEVIVTRRVGDIDLNGAVIHVRDKERNRTKGVPELACIEDERLWPILMSLTLGRDKTAWLFPGERVRVTGHRRREWVTEQVKRICREAGVSEETHAHGMRGAAASAATMNGEFLMKVQAQMGHTPGSAVMGRSYQTAESIARRRQKHLMMAMAGGKAS